MTLRSYAIGDVHGQAALLRMAHELIAKDRRAHGWDDAPVVHLGDLVDRGPSSREVLDIIAAGPAAGAGPWVTLLGNHDLSFELFLHEPEGRDPGLRADLDWLDPRIGGAATLASYGIADAINRPRAEVHGAARTNVPAAHQGLIAGLPRYLERGPVLFVHAGIRPGRSLADQDPGDLVWIRRGFLDHTGPFGWIVIHGHTVVPQPTHYGNRVAIDTGAAYGGPLTTIAVEDRAIWVLTPDGRVPLRP